MIKTEAKPAIAALNGLFAKSPDGLHEIVRAVMQEMLEAEMTDAIGAEKRSELTSSLSSHWRGPRVRLRACWVCSPRCDRAGMN